ncbi:transposase [Mesorhizobium sp. M0998]|uniref:transposase n=1 Tax=Mesorhizobium sp. M0998 TaxID=2957044 RepID=UPI00333870EB
MLTTKIHALVDAEGRPIKLTLTPGRKSDIASAVDMIKDWREGAMLLANKDMMPTHCAMSSPSESHGPTSRLEPTARTRSASVASLTRARNFVERFFNKAKQFRRIATRYDKLAETTLLP